MHATVDVFKDSRLNVMSCVTSEVKVMHIPCVFGTLSGNMHAFQNV